jgi:hypothetical protein
MARAILRSPVTHEPNFMLKKTDMLRNKRTKIRKTSRAKSLSRNLELTKNVKFAKKYIRMRTTATYISEPYCRSEPSTTLLLQYCLIMRMISDLYCEIVCIRVMAVFSEWDGTWKFCV